MCVCVVGEGEGETREERRCGRGWRGGGEMRRKIWCKSPGRCGAPSESFSYMFGSTFRTEGSGLNGQKCLNSAFYSGD